MVVDLKARNSRALFHVPKGTHCTVLTLISFLPTMRLYYTANWDLHDLLTTVQIILRGRRGD